jgi:hypothetical protein
VNQDFKRNEFIYWRILSHRHSVMCNQERATPERRARLDTHPNGVLALSGALSLIADQSEGTFGVEDCSHGRTEKSRASQKVSDK